MIKFIRKLKDKIDFLKWAYKFEHIDAGRPNEINAYITVNNIEPKLIEVKMVVYNNELHQYEPMIRDELIQKFTKEANKVLGMEVQDLMNGTSEASIRCYISPFVGE